MTVITTTVGIANVHALVTASACKLYAKSGIVPNRRLTAATLLEIAGKITGKTYKRGQHMMAHDDIKAMIA